MVKSGGPDMTAFLGRTAGMETIGVIALLVAAVFFAVKRGGG